MSDVKLSNKEEIEKFLSDIRGIEVKINRIQQKKNCLVVSDASAKTELHTYKDDQKPTAEGYESHAFTYIIPINNGKYSPDIVTIGAESHEIWGDVHRGEYMYMIHPTTEYTIRNSNGECIAHIEDDKYTDLTKENPFDLSLDSRGVPLDFSKKFLNALGNKVGPSMALLKEAQKLKRVGDFYDKDVRDEMWYQSRDQWWEKEGKYEAQRKRLERQIKHQKQQEVERRWQKKVEHQRINDALDRVEDRRRARQRKLEDTKLPKVIKEIGKTGIDIDSKIEAVVTVAVKKLER